MKNTFKKPFIAILTSAFLFAGCSSAGSNLPAAEKNVHESNEKSAQIVMDLANQINIAEDGSANYDQIAEKADDATTELKKLAQAVEKADISNNNVTIIKQNAIIQINATARLTAKVEELAKNATGEEPGTNNMNQIIAQLRGLKSRLEGSSAKFNDLNQELTDAVNNPEETNEEPTPSAPEGDAAEATI